MCLDRSGWLSGRFGSETLLYVTAEIQLWVHTEMNMLTLPFVGAHQPR